MGHEFGAKCLDCDETFSIREGGGFFFHLVRCDHCGTTKSIGFDELGELHHSYLKGLPGPYCVASMEHDAHVRKHAKVDPISEEEYHAGIEEIAGKCKCGGHYAFNAPPRCPKCRSTRYKEEGDHYICYD